MLFIAQGGFGGGHGKFDAWLLMLGFPGIFLAQLIPLPTWITHYDISYSVVFPALINTCLIWLCYAISRSKGSSPPPSDSGALRDGVNRP